jgi:hypothetical protein
VNALHARVNELLVHFKGEAEGTTGQEVKGRGAGGHPVRREPADALQPAKTELLIKVVDAKLEALTTQLQEAMASVDGLLAKLQAMAETDALRAQLEEVKVCMEAVLTENQEDLQREVAAATAEQDCNRKRERAEPLEPVHQGCRSNHK